MIGTTVGHYRIDSLLGEGGMGTVYEAFDLTLRRRAALKVLGPDLVANAEALQRFMSEARTASSLNHSNVVTIYEFGDLPSHGRYMAMELVEGQTLRGILEAGRPDRSRVLEWIAQIAHVVLGRPLERGRQRPAAQFRRERPLQHLAATARRLAASEDHAVGR